MLALNNAPPVRVAAFAILLAYVFLVASVAAAPSLASQLTVSKYVEPGDNANLTSLALENISKEAVVLAKINGAETFLLNDTTGLPITDYGTVYSFLDADFYRSSNYSQKPAAQGKTGERAAALIANTNATLDYLAARSGIKERLASKIQAMEGNLTYDFNRTSTVVGVSDLWPMYLDFQNLSNSTRGYLGKNSVRRALANEQSLDELNATLSSEVYKRKMAVVDYQRFCYRIGQKLLELSSNRTLIDQKKELDAINVRYAAIRDDTAIKTYDALIATNSELESMDSQLARLIYNGRPVVPVGDFCIVTLFILFPAVAYLCIENKRRYLPK
ncbi:TPA: hypothetical protein HA316_01650 [Candidatus Micrarchaeota archaeon]|nr:hypothetical protein [Candidatus Micrarchaeota archaeon]